MLREGSPWRRPRRPEEGPSRARSPSKFASPGLFPRKRGARRLPWIRMRPCNCDARRQVRPANSSSILEHARLHDRAGPLEPRPKGQCPVTRLDAHLNAWVRTGPGCQGVDKHPAHVRQRRPSSLASLRSRVASALAESSSHLPSNQSNQPRVDGELSGVLAFFVPPSGAPFKIRRARSA